MRRALLTLSSAGFIASLFFASCTIEKKDDDDDSAGGTGGALSITGGNASIFGSGGNTATNGATFEQSECPDLLTAVRGNSGDVCSTSKKAAQFEKINMLIVLDKSRSMNDPQPPDGKAKWVSAMDSLKAALKVDETLLSYGFMLYPYVDATTAATCNVASGDAAINVPVLPASESVPRINELMAANQPSGGTPTAPALAAAYNYYTTGAGKDLIGTKYVLLVTDGGPNCNAGINCGPETCTSHMDRSGTCDGVTVANCCDPVAIKRPLEDGSPVNSLCLDDVAVNIQLQTMLGQGIKTFVVGIPGSEAYATYLDVFAESGGVPVQGKAHKYYEVKSESDLLAAFTQITTSLVRECEVPLQEEPLDKSRINVAIDCVPILKTATDGTANWEYDQANRRIVVQGKQCELIQTKGVKRIDVVNGCPTIIQL
ncbi:MAG TPA: hypothetical protein VKP30_09010 [Polyangiaceae bacterium]|nr:hypothetical protein [Polyangiaceae bacterium]